MEALAATLFAILSLAGDRMDLPRLADELARADVVFLGEEHDNDAGHAAQLEILRALHERRPDLVLSLEMFERDVQAVLDDYLKGRIAEEVFLAHARPWSNYTRHYRPLVEFARERGLDVIAANAPRASARRLAGGGAAESAYVARSTSAPDDRYLELFREAMKEHPGEVSESSLLRMYAAQCLKDDTMAESIVGYMDTRPYRRPLIVHVCGKFHSDYGLGTVARVQSRRPLTRTLVVSMESADDVEEATGGVRKALARGHFLLVVKSQKKQAEAAAGAGEESAPLESDAAGEPAAGEADPRPAAMGIMPDYGAEEAGVLVGTAFEGRAAHAAGVRDGDLIIKMGAGPVGSVQDYMGILDGYRPGDKVKVTVLRDGHERVFDVVLEASRR